MATALTIAGVASDADKPHGSIRIRRQIQLKMDLGDSSPIPSRPVTPSFKASPSLVKEISPFIRSASVRVKQQLQSTFSEPLRATEQLKAFPRMLLDSKISLNYDGKYMHTKKNT